MSCLKFVFLSMPGKVNQKGCESLKIWIPIFGGAVSKVVGLRAWSGSHSWAHSFLNPYGVDYRLFFR